MTRSRVPEVRLGANGPLVGTQGLGCMGMSFAYGPAGPAECRATLERALELGVTLLDTADMYGEGENERFLAPFVRAHREEVTLATKFGICPDPEDSGRTRVRNDAAYIRQCVEGSLSRLGVEAIDLYYMHRRQLDVPIEETVGTMAELVREGKVKHLGLSEVTGDELRAAHTVHPIAAVQTEWSVFSRDVERTAVPAARDLGTAFVPYSPLGRGFLTGSFVRADSELADDDFRRTMPRFTGENGAANAELLAPLRELAARGEATMGQIALAWVHAQAGRWGLPVVPIPGTTKRTRLAENAAATALTLDESELALLDTVAERVAGGRYPDMSLTSLSRE